MVWVEVPAHRSRRRAIVFSAAFLSAAAASLTYTFTRPAEYRAAARLEITPTQAPAIPPGDTVTGGAPSDPNDAASFLTEVQVLTSRPLLGDVVQRLGGSDALPDLGADPVAGVQRMLSAEPVAGTHVVVLSADGPEPAFLAGLVNTVTDAYRQHLANAYADSAASATVGLVDEEKSLAQDVAQKQSALEAYRKRYDIVSLERNENQVLAKLNGLNNAYNDANAQLAIAQGKLDAAKKMAAEGPGAVSAKDDPTLADLEQRASKINEHLQAYLRTYTSAYLDLDPEAKGMRAELAELQKEIAARRVTGGQAAVASAQEAYTSAKLTVERLGNQIAESQHDAQDFATHLNAYKALQEDLDHIEGLHRSALDRLTQLQASTRQRAPQLQILEAATSPRAPWSPDYRTDAVVGLAGSLAFGLFAALLGEFIVGPAPSAGMIVRHTWEPSALEHARLVPPERELAPPPRLVELPAPEPPLRELDDAELTALLSAGDDARLVCVALLMGLAADELVALRWEAVDLGGNVIRVPGNSGREFVLEDPLRGLIAVHQNTRPEALGTLLHDANGAPLGVDELARLVLYAAYDAGLDRPHEITPAVLRHTYLAFLLRQGIRMGDLGRLAGHIPQADLVAYMQVSGSGTRLPFEKIDRVLPALRGLAAP